MRYEMKYLGIYHDYNFPNINLPRFIDYINNIEVFTSYIAETPFFIKQIAILLDRTDNYSAYDVFECHIDFATDMQAKYFARTFAENLIKYRREFSNYHNMRK
jgi:hypothetical protein